MHINLGPKTPTYGLLMQGRKRPTPGRWDDLAQAVVLARVAFTLLAPLAVIVAVVILAVFTL